MAKAIIFKDEFYEILGACFEVYNAKGSGFLENVYQECLEIEFKYRGIPFVSQKPLMIDYRRITLNSTYVPDFICYDKIILEIKALSLLTGEHRAQVHNYIKGADYLLGILVNFGHYPKIQYERILSRKAMAECEEEVSL